MLPLPEKKSLDLANGRSLQYLGERDIGDVKDMRFWAGLDGLKVLASIDNTPHGKLLHVSISYSDKDPSWDIIRLVKQCIFSDNQDAVMLLPRQEVYVNAHPHTFHIWETPEKWEVG
jgi:hypothetical protein